jgi:hypothetical protein
MSDPTIPCPRCGHPARFVGRFDPHVATWNCDEDSCTMGGFSEHVWPWEHTHGFQRLPDMTQRALRSALETARVTSYPELAAAIVRELASRWQSLADAAGRSAGR